MAADNEAAPTAIRLNLVRGRREEILARIKNDGLEVAVEGRFPETLILKGSPHLDSASFRDGLFHVQSEASQIVARLLAPTPGATVVDCSAAPGGKATHLAELVGARGRVIALDLNFAGLRNTRGVAERLGHSNLFLARADVANAIPLRPTRFRLCVARCAMHRDRHAEAASGDSMAPASQRSRAHGDAATRDAAPRRGAPASAAVRWSIRCAA